MIRRLAAMAIAAMLVVSAVPTSTAQDRGALARSLAGGGDFRVRVAAALALGKSGDKAAREPLEKALGDEHPAVRVAAAAALGALGDPAALPALKAARARETATNVRTQLESTILRLSGLAADRPGKAKFLVALGRVDDKSGSSPGIATHLQKSARFQLGQLPTAELLAADADLGAEGKARHLPVFALDGALTRLEKGQKHGEVTYSAKVEFLIRRMPDQTLKGTVSGAAQALADARSIRNETDLAQLQRDAVSAAVESAMRGATPALEAAVK